jgi:hypothetical protein
MIALYRKLLCLYPAEYRNLFGEEMLAVLLQKREENATRRLRNRARLVLRETTGLLRGAFHEHFRMITEIHEELSFVTGRFAMRNGFRFPKSTIFFMTLILGGVLTAIKKGEDIATSVPHDVGPVAPVHIQSVHSIWLGGMPLFFAIFYAAGLIGWAILFALRRSGVHRLDSMSITQK